VPTNFPHGVQDARIRGAGGQGAFGRPLVGLAIREGITKRDSQFDDVRAGFRIARDTGVNYLIAARKG
jgi:hypothetical protein